MSWFTHRSVECLGLCSGERTTVCEDVHITLGRNTADVRLHHARVRGSGESARRTGHQLADDRRVVVKVPVSQRLLLFGLPARLVILTENEVWLSLSEVLPEPE
jgi:hypothetical protein